MEEQNKKKVCTDGLSLEQKFHMMRIQNSIDQITDPNDLKFLVGSLYVQVCMLQNIVANVIKSQALEKLK